ncbi:hypothetical protein JAAARDRAFT_160917 [Jaapia argillacea MUCL 33604]|uniref:C2H2-type domain-containing protein n=1 Tax=Jaapia argillacea MUCL 33604 TaxID=933084 RepID=A0A067PHW3_9AGAM|nr:hypothetical protein JAAARDRAFT_160917 [Jaapia argillacea MUCL 33604]
MLSVPGEASSQVMTPGVRRASINRRKNPGNFICDWCSETFTRSSNLRDHYRAHNRERPYPCSTCEQTFTRRSDMRRHARAKH